MAWVKLLFIRNGDLILNSHLTNYVKMMQSFWRWSIWLIALGYVEGQQGEPALG